MTCGFFDCGDPGCPTCRWSRPPYASGGRRSASVVEPMRDDARAEPKPGAATAAAAVSASGRYEHAPKRKTRVGPLR